MQNQKQLKRQNTRRNPLLGIDKNDKNFELGQIIFFDKNGTLASTRSGRIENFTIDGEVVECKPGLVEIKNIPQKKLKIDLLKLKDGFYCKYKAEYTSDTKHKIYLEADNITILKSQKVYENSISFYNDFIIEYNNQKFYIQEFTHSEKTKKGSDLENLTNDINKNCGTDLYKYTIEKILENYDIIKK